MKKTFLTIITSICLAILFGFSNFKAVNFAYANSEPQKTVFMISPLLIASANDSTYVYDSTDLSIKRIDETPANSTSYIVGEIKDMCAYNKQILMLNNEGIKIFDTENFEITNIALNWISESYTKISINNVNENTILAIYGDTTDLPIKTAEFTPGEVPMFHDVSIIDSTHGTTINFAKYVYLENNEYLIRVSESHFIFYALNIGIDNELNNPITISNIANPENIIGVEYNGCLLITFADKTNKYTLSTSTSNITATLDSTLLHSYEPETTFEAKDTSLSHNNLYLLSNDSYYIVDVTNLTFTNQMTNALCTEEPLSKTEYKYYKVTDSTNLISTLGNSSYITVPENSYVIEIATSTLSDNSPLVGYKFVLYVEVKTNGQYNNHYGYIIDNNNLTEIVTQESTDIVLVSKNTKIYSYPSVYVDGNKNQIEYSIASASNVNVLLDLGEYKTGNGDNAVSYMLVNYNNHIGFIDKNACVSPDKKTIITMPNATIISTTNVHEQPDNTSQIIANLQKDYNVRIIGTRDKNGYIKIAFNLQNGHYYEGYVLASSVRSNSYTILQTIGTVLVALNIILLSVLITTKKKIAP